MDVAFAFGAAEVEAEATARRLVHGSDFSAGEIVVSNEVESGARGALFYPVPVLRDALFGIVEGWDLESPPVAEGHGAVAAADLFALGGDVDQSVDMGG